MYKSWNKPHVFYIILSITSWVIQSAIGFRQISDATMLIFQVPVKMYVCVHMYVFDTNGHSADH